MSKSRELLSPTDLIPELPGPVRGALRAIFSRLGGNALPPIEAESRLNPTGRSLASPCENRRLLLRANAHAAHDSVQGSPDAALDTALAVMEAAWLEACEERNAYAEALKAIRMYSEDARVRSIAAHSLTPCARDTARTASSPPTSYDA